MGYRVIGFEMESGYKCFGLYEITQYIILDWGFVNANIDENSVKKARFKDPDLKKDLLEGCAPESFFACSYREDAEKVAELLDPLD